MSTVHSGRNFNDWVTFSFFPLDKHEHMSIFLLPSPLVCISGSKKDKKHYLGFNNPNTCPQQREKASEQLWQFHIACWATLYLFLLFKLSYRRYKLVWNELAQVFIHQINIVPFFRLLWICCPNWREKIHWLVNLSLACQLQHFEKRVVIYHQIN